MKNILNKIKWIFTCKEEESFINFINLKIKIKKSYVEKLLILFYLVLVFSLIK
jgi:hypothetical protein